MKGPARIRHNKSWAVEIVLLRTARSADCEMRRLVRLRLGALEECNQ